MKKRIIKIDENKCNGCGMCILACRESALGLVDGKARLMREDHCDGLGQCLPMCLQDAISFVELDQSPKDSSKTDYTSDALADSKVASSTPRAACPGTTVRAGSTDSDTCLQWPLQIKLVPETADFYKDADLLVAADCCAYTYPNFYQEFVASKTRVLGCPKLDECDYSEKLAQILANNDIASITSARMEVPCCDGIERAVKTAVQMSGKDIAISSVVISVEGTVL